MSIPRLGDKPESMEVLLAEVQDFVECAKRMDYGFTWTYWQGKKDPTKVFVSVEHDESSGESTEVLDLSMTWDELDELLDDGAMREAAEEDGWERNRDHSGEDWIDQVYGDEADLYRAWFDEVAARD